MSQAFNRSAGYYTSAPFRRPAAAGTPGRLRGGVDGGEDGPPRDYTQLRFPRRGHADRLRARLPALAGRVTGARIDREERKGKGASDHAPVIVDLADPPRSASITER
jgi:hypothetical protein